MQCGSVGYKSIADKYHIGGMRSRTEYRNTTAGLITVKPSAITMHLTSVYHVAMVTQRACSCQQQQQQDDAHSVMDQFHAAVHKNDLLHR